MYIHIYIPLPPLRSRTLTTVCVQIHTPTLVDLCTRVHLHRSEAYKFVFEALLHRLATRHCCYLKKRKSLRYSQHAMYMYTCIYIYVYTCTYIIYVSVYIHIIYLYGKRIPCSRTYVQILCNIILFGHRWQRAR